MLLSLLLVLAGLGYINLSVNLTAKELEKNPGVKYAWYEVAAVMFLLPLVELVLKPIGNFVRSCGDGLLNAVALPVRLYSGDRIFRLEAGKETEEIEHSELDPDYELNEKFRKLEEKNNKMD